MEPEGRNPGGRKAIVRGYSQDEGQLRTLFGHKSHFERIRPMLRTPSMSRKAVFHHPIEDDPCLDEAFVH